MPKLLHLIVACSENRVIGRDGKLPWRIPEDWEFFERETAGKICVLGRICFVSWPRACADGRQPIVLTSWRLVSTKHPFEIASGQQGTAHQPILVPSFSDALIVAETSPGEIYICGGQRVYEETLALKRPMRLHLTLIHATVPGDTYFPEWRQLPWRELARRESSDANYRYTFLTLDLPAPLNLKP